MQINTASALRILLIPILALAFLATIEGRPDFRKTESLYYSGEYEEALYQATEGREDRPWSEMWWRLEAEILLTLGRYEEARDLLYEGLNRQPHSFRLKLLARDAALYTDQLAEADRHLTDIRRMISRYPSYGYDPDSLVALGDSALLLEVEPRVVLENFYKRAQQDNSPPVSAFLAAGRLALSKNDYRLASQHFGNGLQEFPDNPDLLQGLANSFINGDRTQLIANATKALEINPGHVASRNLLARHLIDAEAYEEANKHLDTALQTNPFHPETLALKASIAYLQNNDDIGNAFRDAALNSWSLNPYVDYLIGKKLSQKYRFKEGSEFQRWALVKDSGYVPSRIQLAQDLLRLGKDEEGWKLAAEVHDDDPYDIAAYNLVTLRDELENFTTLESDLFKVRMTPKEASIYGQRVLDLLHSANDELSERYGYQPEEKVTVEIYPNPSDFETRTFGMPGNPGFLGVCFGPVITINSPKTYYVNWEAVLYHEYCHTITLGITRNRMPRWLSEGISVYEERRANGSWGQMMSIDYHDRIMAEEMLPISEMSAAFLTAKTNDDVQFAYFQSSLIVAFLFENYGLGTMRTVLRDLGNNVALNDSLTQHAAPLEELDRDFLVFAKKEADKLGGKLALLRERDVSNFLVQQGTDEAEANYFDDLDQAKELIAAEDWNAAKEELKRVIDEAGYIPGDENAHIHLAKVYRKLGDKENEIATLEMIASNEGNELEPVSRLLDIAVEDSNWEKAIKWSDAWIAISPLAETPWRSQLIAAAHEQEIPKAIAAGETLISLEPTDIASIRYRLATLYRSTDPERAKRNVLMALEDAPRFREAYKLLAELRNAPTESEAVPVQ